MRCTTCGCENAEGDRFCGACGSSLPLSCGQCGTITSADDKFCGSCGSVLLRDDETPVRAGNSEQNLFPLHGVTLGKTTVEELAQLGQRTSSVDKSTGLPYPYYKIHGIDFWYNNKSGSATALYIAKGVSSIPEPWRAIGFKWELSYEQWLSLLRRLGYSVTVEEPPRVVTYDGHDSFSARVLATKTATPSITLDFNYNKGSNTDSEATLYSISAKAP